MTRPATLMLTGIALLGLGVVWPKFGFAQSDPILGTWQLNLSKSKYSPPTYQPKSETMNIQSEGQDIKLTRTGTDANGKPINIGGMVIFDGLAHPVTGTPDFDAITRTRIDAYTWINTYAKAGKLTGTRTYVVSPDGKIQTSTVIAIDANGRPVNYIAVYDKQ